MVSEAEKSYVLMQVLSDPELAEYEVRLHSRLSKG